MVHGGIKEYILYMYNAIWTVRFRWHFILGVKTIMNNSNLMFEAIATINDRIAYASSYQANGLFEVDLENYECTYISLFPKEEISRSRLHSVAILIERKIYFIPSFAKNISIYDIDTRTIQQISIPHPIIERYFYKEKFKFINAKLYDNNLWIFPSTYPGILKLNIKTLEMDIIDNWVPEEKYFFRNALCVDDDIVYLPDGISNRMLVFNMANQEAKIINIGKNNHGISSMKLWNNKYWMAPRLDGSVISWNPISNAISEYVEYPEEFRTEKIVFNSILICEEKIYLMPASANSVISIEDSKLQVSNIWKPRDNSMVEVLFETDKYYFFREVLEDGLITEQFKISKFNCKISKVNMYVVNYDTYIENFIKASKKCSEAIKENQVLTLQDFMIY